MIHPLQIIKEQADSYKHSQDVAELSASLQLIYRIAEMMLSAIEQEEPDAS